MKFSKYYLFAFGSLMLYFNVMNWVISPHLHPVMWGVNLVAILVSSWMLGQQVGLLLAAKYYK